MFRCLVLQNYYELQELVTELWKVYNGSFSSYPAQALHSDLYPRLRISSKFTFYDSIFPTYFHKSLLLGKLLFLKRLSQLTELKRKYIAPKREV